MIAVWEIYGKIFRYYFLIDKILKLGYRTTHLLAQLVNSVTECPTEVLRRYL